MVSRHAAPPPLAITPSAPMYRHVRYEQLVTYEFLLPLTREDRLRRALDGLFYSDTIERRLREIGLEAMEAIVPRDSGCNDAEYIAALLALVSSRFIGYSITHVNGRYRAADLLSRRAAGELLAQEGRYLVDETTAVVRFLIKCNSTRTEYEPHLPAAMRAMVMAEDPPAGATAAEIRLIRALFFALFAEAVVHSVEGEDEIWLLEDGPGRRLYVWERAV